LYAQTLTPKDLRDPETSKQIAKRMRELHEGIDLLREEREAGPFVWQNYYKWINICEKRVTWLDQQVQSKDYVGLSKGWKQDGPILGAEWEFFKQTVEKYRKWLVDQYGGQQKLNERLVFAHNDVSLRNKAKIAILTCCSQAQYGNILRLEPAGESPLLLPANEHKQLVVIDFEYANANLPGLEFANHFVRPVIHERRLDANGR
jgi:choline kinase